MKKGILSIAALASIVLVAVMSLGYFGSFEIWIQLFQVGSPPVLKLINFVLDDGRCRMSISSYSLPSGATGQILRIIDARVRLFPVSFRANRWLTAFDAHYVTPTTYLVSAPAWCPILLSCIAPSLWLIKRMRRKAIVRGFEVQTNTKPTVVNTPIG